MRGKKYIITPAWIVENTTPHLGPLGTPCWLWNGKKTYDGYGKLGIATGSRRAHRRAYEAFYGPIESRDEIHHECQVHACCNPNHLKRLSKTQHTAVTISESAAKGWPQNQKPGDLCKRGHKLVPRGNSGRRKCNECHKIAVRKYRGKQPANDASDLNPQNKSNL